MKYIIWGEHYQKMKICISEMDLQSTEWGASWYCYFTLSFRNNVCVCKYICSMKTVYHLIFPIEIYRIHTYRKFYVQVQIQQLSINVLTHNNERVKRLLKKRRKFICYIYLKMLIFSLRIKCAIHGTISVNGNW